MRVLSQRQIQPPSGGCVLKPEQSDNAITSEDPAAFGRLCVETVLPLARGFVLAPAAFGRLCVETYLAQSDPEYKAPAAFGRLCVETNCIIIDDPHKAQPPSGGCVLKLWRAYR